MSKTLEQKNTRYLLTWLPLVLLLGCVLFYVILTGHARHMQGKQLELKQQNIWQEFSAGALPMKITGEYIITKLRHPVNDTGKIQDTDSGYTVLSKQYKLNGDYYLLTTLVTSKEYAHLLVKVFATEVLVFILLLLSIVVINRKSSRRIWQPFYQTLQAASNYDIVKNSNLLLSPETGVIEFNQLNKELTDLIEKNTNAYRNQKQFVENASHEIQTPLAIIRSKLDLLINEPGLTEGTALLLADITLANDRLSQLNKSLLLLAKIDNNQFPELEKVNISQLLTRIIANYQEHYNNFPVTNMSLADDIYLTTNPALIEILFSNLVKNAVVHNYPGGYIHIKLDSDQFIIENSGTSITTDPSLLFERFSKGAADAKTTGLGLALVKQIAQLYGMGVNYVHQNGIHHINVIFNTGDRLNLS